MLAMEPAAFEVEVFENLVERLTTKHHDYIDAGDFPMEWLGWPLTVEVEAKAKELAVARLIADLNGEGGSHAR